MQGAVRKRKRGDGVLTAVGHDGEGPARGEDLVRVARVRELDGVAAPWDEGHVGAGRRRAQSFADAKARKPGNFTHTVKLCEKVRYQRNVGKIAADVPAHLGGDVHERRDREDAVERLVVGVDHLDVDRAGVTLAELPSDGVGRVEHP